LKDILITTSKELHFVIRSYQKNRTKPIIFSKKNFICDF